jgi:hypothetical protein
MVTLGKHPFKAFATLAFAGTLAVSASASTLVYQASDSTTNFIPETDDGTPGRPIGDQMGNTVTLAGSERFLTLATIKVGTNDVSIGNQTVTLKLFLNDGPADPGGSGLFQPGTLIGSATVSDVAFGVNGEIVPVTFSFPSVEVPNTFTFIVDFTPGSAPAKLLGLLSNHSSAQIGSSPNTLWYGTGAPGAWLTNSTWAIADGAAINVVDAVFEADAIGAPAPEPTGFCLALLGALALAGRRPARR